MGLGCGGVDAAEDDPGVLRGGDGGKDSDGAEQIAAQQELVHGGPDLVDEDEGEAQDLDERVELAEQGGAEVAEGAGGEEQGGDEQDSEVAAEDEDGDITRDQAHVGEDQEEGAEEELVGDGVEILAEDGALGERASEEAVEAVAEAGDDEESECDAIVAVQDGDDQKRDDEEPHEREQIGSGAKLGEKRHLVWADPIVRYFGRECRMGAGLPRGKVRFRLRGSSRGA